MRKLNPTLRSVVDDEEEDMTQPSMSQESASVIKREINMQSTTSILSSCKVPQYMLETDGTTTASRSSTDVLSTGHGIGVPVKRPGAKSGKLTTHKLFISRDKRTILLSNSLGKSDVGGEVKSKGLFRRSTESIETKKISKFSKSVDIADIDRIQRGQFSFRHPIASTSSRSIESTTALSIIYDNGMKSLDFIVQDVTEFEDLIRTINDLIKAYKDACSKVHPDVLLAENLWLMQEKQFTEKASVSEICDMLYILSLSLSKKEVTSLIKHYCELQLGGKHSSLNLFQTAGFLSYLRKTTQGRKSDPLARVMKKITGMSTVTVNDTSFSTEINNERTGISTGSNDDTATNVTQSHNIISAEALQKFLRFKQKEKKTTLSQAKAICVTYNKLAHEKEPTADYMTKDALKIFLMHEENDIFNPVQTKVGRCDMTQPLSHYWINTSNKTFNSGADSEDRKNILRKSNNKGLQFLHALYRGCRAIEIDVWDGGNAFQREPVVCQSADIITKDPERVTLFVDVLSAIRSYLLSYKDSYPIILSIENHCSVPYQNVMGSHLFHVLDDMVHIPKGFVGVLPSPEALKGKVVIRSKRPDAIGENPATLFDDFDVDNDFTTDQAAQIQTEVLSEPDYDQKHGVQAGSLDVMSFISSAPEPIELSAKEIVLRAEMDAEKTKRSAELTETHAFECNVKASQAEKNVEALLARLGITADQLDIIDKQRNTSEQASQEYAIHNRVKGLFKKAKEDYEANYDADPSYYEALDTGVHASQSMAEGDEGVEVEDFFSNEVGVAKKRYAAAQAEANVAGNAASLALVGLQEAILEVSEACEKLQDAQKLITDDHDAAKNAANAARTNREHANTAAQRQITVRDLLRTRKEALQNAESVASTALAESKISQSRAKEAQARASKAQEIADTERNYAEVETKKEEDMEAKAASLHRQYMSTLGTEKVSRGRIDKITHSIKNIERRIKEIEDSPIFKEDKQEWLRRRLDNGANQTPTSKVLIKHKQLTEERKALNDVLQDAIESSDVNTRNNVQQDFDEATVQARKQAGIAAIARKQADKSVAIAERLAEQAEEETEAANLRMIACEKAEIFVRRCEAEYESTIEQFNEANRAAKETEDLAMDSQQKADKLAKISARNTVDEEKILQQKEIAERRAREKFEAAEKVKVRLDGRLAEAKRALDRSTEIFTLAKDEIAAETYRTNAAKHAEKNAAVARSQAVLLRKKADEAEEKSREAQNAHAEAAAVLANALDYKKKKDKIKPLSLNLAKLILISSTKFKYWEKSLALPYLHSHNICEGLMVFLSERGPTEWFKWVEFNKKHLTRTFPSMAYRQSSSNYNPMIPWAMGCQLVGMNIQSSSGMTLLVDGRFRENGSTGYVLKPQRLLEKKVYSDEVEKESPKTLRLRVISGQNLPKPDCARKKSPIVSPRVKVIVYDGIPGKGSVQHTTKVVDKNGFNPVWDDEGATFNVASPSVAVVLFSVWDADEDTEKDYFIAASAVPFTCLRQGFRNIVLFDANRSRRGLYGTANLFVELSIQ